MYTKFASKVITYALIIPIKLTKGTNMLTNENVQPFSPS